MEFQDNQACLDLLDKTGGVISLLKDELRLPDGSDSRYLQKLYNAHENHPFFELPNFKTTEKNTFTIKHYPAPVEYTVTGFLEKNRLLCAYILANYISEFIFHRNSRHKISDDIQVLFQSSKNHIVAVNIRFFTIFLLLVVKTIFNVQKIFMEDSETQEADRKLELLGSTKSHRPSKITSLSRGATKNDNANSTAEQFRRSLSALLVSIRATSPHFIRCIKPNEFKRPMEFDCSMVMRQLETSGIMDAVVVRQLGYSERYFLGIFSLD